MSKDNKPEKPAAQVGLLTPEQIKSIKADNVTVISAYKKFIIERKKVGEVSRLINLCKMDTYVEQQSKIHNVIDWLFLIGIAYCAVKPKRLAYKILTCGTLLAFYGTIYSFYGYRRQLRNIALSNNYTVPEQEVRNLYEFYFPSSKEAAQMKHLTGQYFEYRQAKQELEKFRYEN